MKIQIKILLLGLLTIIIISSCNKKKFEAMKTAFFYTQIPLTEEVLTLYIDNSKIGEVPCVSEGIDDYDNREKGLKHLFSNGHNHIVVKNSQDDILMETTVVVKKEGREIHTENQIKGDVIVTSHEYNKKYCVIIKLSK